MVTSCIELIEYLDIHHNYFVWWDNIIEIFLYRPFGQFIYFIFLVCIFGEKYSLRRKTDASVNLTSCFPLPEDLFSSPRRNVPILSLIPSCFLYGFTLKSPVSMLCLHYLNVYWSRPCILSCFSIVTHVMYVTLFDICVFFLHLWYVL